MIIPLFLLTLSFLDQYSALNPEIQKLLSKTPVFDGHNDLPYQLRLHLQNQIGKSSTYDFKTDLSKSPQAWQINPLNNKTHFIATDLTRAKNGFLSAQFFSAYVSCGSQYKDAVRQTFEQIDLIKRLSEMYPEDMQFCESEKCVRDCFRNGKFASLIGLEGGHHLDSSLALIRIYHDLGVRYIAFNHFCNTPWSDYCDSNFHNGITDFGLKVVQEMNRVGMIIDLSYTSHQTMRQTISNSKLPVMFSHSQAFGQFNTTKNIPDDVLISLKENNGIMMVNFIGEFLCEKMNESCGIESVLDHLNYVRELLGGSGNLGIGSAFDGISLAVKGLEDVSKFPVIFERLYEDFEWSLEELEGLASDNLLRVMRDNEQGLINEDVDESWIDKTDLENSDNVEVCRTDLFLYKNEDESTTTEINTTSGSFSIIGNVMAIYFCMLNF